MFIDLLACWAHADWLACRLPRQLVALLTLTAVDSCFICSER